MNNMEYFKIAQDIINAVVGDTEEKNKEYIVWYETDLSDDWIRVLNSEWFFVYLNEVMKWSMVRGVCKIRNENKSWGSWIIAVKEISESELEDVVLRDLGEE